MKRMSVLLFAMAVAFRTGSLFANEGHDHDEAKEEIASGETAQTKKYVCPMHADVQSDKPGQCSKCGMTLKQVSQEYVCPMHADVQSDKPGQCSKCGMTLKEAAQEEMPGKESHEEQTHEHHP